MIGQPPSDGAEPPELLPGPTPRAETAPPWLPLSTAGWRPESADVVGRLFHRALAGIFLVAWLSLGKQVLLLVGSRGLLPLVDFVAAARGENVLSFWDFPSVLAWVPGDGMLFWGTVAGASLSLLALVGFRPRLCAALQTAWYLGYVTACRGFLGFQWDNLLLECGLLASFLPAHRSAPLMHFLLRALLFKLYFESGLAKWLSPLHDWQDGSAMSFYYQTAPLPTWLAWYAHHLPRGWHVFESYATLAIELILPFAIFGPRRARHTAAALFTLFQIINAATANYGFFCHVTVVLHLLLLDDRDVKAISRLRVIRAPLSWAMRAGAMMRARLLHGRAVNGRSSTEPSTAPPSIPEERPQRKPSSPVRRGAAWMAAGAWAFVSLAQALFHFGGTSTKEVALTPVLEWAQTFRVVNAYHLFAAVTRERIEPEVQIRSDSNGPWTAYHLHYKPGELTRAPRFVAPHQPRVDFALWFYGLAFQRRQPSYVGELMARLCEDPATVASLFLVTPPSRPAAVRIVFWDYRFTTAAEKRATAAWWTRREIGATPPLDCGRAVSGDLPVDR